MSRATSSNSIISGIASAKGRGIRTQASPVCIVIKTPGNPDVVFLFPFTSKPPLPGQLALSVPEMECRRTGLTAPCWIILDEYNPVEMDKDYDFVGTDPIGSVSPAFLREIATTIRHAVQSATVRAVNRT